MPQRRRLHARAAWGLEEASAGRLEEVAGVLGRHYALAGETERAAHYLELAGDRAAAAFANEEAIASYRWALELVGAGAGPLLCKRRRCSSNWESSFAARALRRRRGRRPRRHQGLHRRRPVAGSGLLCLVGEVDADTHHHEGAPQRSTRQRNFCRTERKRTMRTRRTSGWTSSWRASRFTTGGTKRTLGRRSLLVPGPGRSACGTQHQKALFYEAKATMRCRERRYLIDASILADHRAAWAAAVEGGLEAELSWMQFDVGFVLLWYGDLVAAEAALQSVLVVARRAGNKVLELRCLTYLACAHLRQREVATVREMAPQVEELAGALSFPEYSGMAKALMSWVAWKEGRPADAEPLALEALAHWGTCVVHYSFYWVCLWPLIAVRLGSGQVAEAVEAGRQLLEPPQLRLPDQLESVVQAGIAAWEEGESQSAARTLGHAVDLAERLRYA